MSNISKINGLDISAADAQYVAAGNVDGPLGYNSVTSAITASYVSPTFISASAAAAGFGAAGAPAATSSWAIQAQTASYSTALGASLTNPSVGQIRLFNSVGTTISSINNLTASLATSASFASTSSYYSDWGGGLLRATAANQTDLSGIKLNLIASNQISISSSTGTYVLGDAAFSAGEVNFAGTRVWIQANTPLTASNVLITGSTNFNNNGSIYLIPGGGGIQIDGNSRVFVTASNEISFGALNGISFNQGTVTFNKAVLMTALTSASQNYVLTYNPTNGGINYTASSAIGGGGGSATSASFANTASYVNPLSQDVTINGNLSVLGSASFTYLTASQLAVSQSYISVNVFEPQQRFGGLYVYDSGSSAATASLTWDSLYNRWIYSNASGSTYSGGMIMNGPRNTGALGEEQGTTNNALMKGQGGDHITSSGIFDDGTNVYANRDMQLTGSLTVTGNVIATSSWATNAQTASYSTTLGANLLQPAAGILRLRSSNGTVLTEITSFAAAYATTASYVTGSNVSGPYGSNSVLSSSYALTASYALNGGGGVTSIIAGTGISVNQSTGAVTVSATGGSTGGTNLGLVYAVSLGYLMP